MLTISSRFIFQLSGQSTFRGNKQDKLNVKITRLNFTAQPDARAPSPTAVFQRGFVCRPNSVTAVLPPQSSPSSYPELLFQRSLSEDDHEQDPGRQSHAMLHPQLE